MGMGWCDVAITPKLLIKTRGLFIYKYLTDTLPLIAILNLDWNVLEHA